MKNSILTGRFILRYIIYSIRWSQRISASCIQLHLYLTTFVHLIFEMSFARRALISIYSNCSLVVFFVPCPPCSSTNSVMSSLSWALQMFPNLGIHSNLLRPVYKRHHAGRCSGSELVFGYPFSLFLWCSEEFATCIPALVSSNVGF